MNEHDDISLYILAPIFGLVIGFGIIQLPWQVFQSFAIILISIIFFLFSVVIYVEHKHKKFLQNTIEEKSKLISFVSHEIRKSITIFKFGCEIILAKDTEQLTQNQREMLQRLISEADVMLQLTTDFLNVSKSDMHRLEILLQSVTLETLQKEIEGKITRFRAIAGDKGIIIQHHIRLNPRLQVQIDLLRIMDVVVNLLENAIRYTPSKGIVRIAVTNDIQHVIFTIEDTGIGIPQGDQKKIFNEFFRSENARQQYSSGTGIGLYLCKKYINGHNGVISFASSEHKGTTFKFTLPLGGENTLESVLKAI